MFHALATTALAASLVAPAAVPMTAPAAPATATGRAADITSAVLDPPPARSLRAAMRALEMSSSATRGPSASDRERGGSVAPAGPPRRSSIVKKIAFGAIGAGAGLYAGAYLGAAIENGVSPCHCDDPGLVGALIGAPVGMVFGAIVGVLVAGR